MYFKKCINNIKKLLIGELDSNDKTILTDWYNSLSSQTLNWDVDNLCDQDEITCDSSDPQRVIGLYPLLKAFLVRP